MQPIERKIITALVSEAIRCGYMLSVFDGEETTVRNSRDEQTVLNALASTDHDTLTIKTLGGAHVGAVVLIWGNGEDVISDSTTDHQTESLCDFAQRAAA